MEAILLSNGCIELPDEIRRRMGIDAGTRFEVRVEARTGVITLKSICCEYFSNRIKMEEAGRLLFKSVRQRSKAR